MSEENTQEQTEKQPGMDVNIAAALVENQIAEPKSSQGLFELPCGYVDDNGVLHKEIKVREITGHEEDMLANPKIPSVKKINDLITNCIERVGTITDKGQLSKVVLDMYVGDRLFAIFAIRRITVGDMYTYEEKCDNTECKAISRYTIDLNDLEVKTMGDPMKKEFEVVLPRSKRTIKFSPLTGRGEAKANANSNKNKDSALSMGMLLRIISVDDEPPTLKAIKDLSYADRNHLRNKFKEVEGGIETGIDLDCPVCGEEFNKDLDISQPGFFFPTEAQ